MGNGEIKTPLTGAELLEFINSRNTKQAALGSVDDIAAYIRELGIPAEVLMIILLQDILCELKSLQDIKTEIEVNRLHLESISNEKFTKKDLL